MTAFVNVDRVYWSCSGGSLNARGPYTTCHRQNPDPKGGLSVQRPAAEEAERRCQRYMRPRRTRSAWHGCTSWQPAGAATASHTWRPRCHTFPIGVGWGACRGRNCSFLLLSVPHPDSTLCPSICHEVPFPVCVIPGSVPLLGSLPSPPSPANQPMSTLSLASCLGTCCCRPCGTARSQPPVLPGSCVSCMGTAQRPRPSSSSSCKDKGRDRDRRLWRQRLLAVPRGHVMSWRPWRCSWRHR